MEARVNRERREGLCLISNLGKAGNGRKERKEAQEGKNQISGQAGEQVGK